MQPPAKLARASLQCSGEGYSRIESFQAGMNGGETISVGTSSRNWTLKWKRKHAKYQWVVQGHEKVPARVSFIFPMGVNFCLAELIGLCFLVFLSFCSWFQKLFRKSFSLEYQNRLNHLEFILVSKVRTPNQFSQWLS